MFTLKRNRSPLHLDCGEISYRWRSYRISCYVGQCGLNYSPNIPENRLFKANINSYIVLVGILINYNASIRLQWHLWSPYYKLQKKTKVSEKISNWQQEKINIVSSYEPLTPYFESLAIFWVFAINNTIYFKSRTVSPIWLSHTSCYAFSLLSETIKSTKNI